MPRFIDRTGFEYGRLRVLAFAGRTSKKCYWFCVCTCGAFIRVPAGSLSTGNTTSCGCATRDAIVKHGMHKRRSYNTWRAMMRRCYNSADKDYARYGAVGIVVHPPWHTYTTFVAEMGEPPDGCTLDRIDPYGDYTPNNCRWASLAQQARNTRVRKSSKTGEVGISMPYPGRWMAKVTRKKKAYYSAVCRSLPEAVAARDALRKKHWGD